MLLILNIIGKRRQACKQRIEVVKPRKITWKSRENHRYVRDKKDVAWQTCNPYQAPVGSILSTRGTYFVWAEASFSTLHDGESKVRLQLSLFLSTGREKKAPSSVCGAGRQLGHRTMPTGMQTFKIQGISYKKQID